MIDLDEINSLKPISSVELIHRKQFQHFKDILFRNYSKNRLCNIDTPCRDIQSCTKHAPCYFISGGRGSGKSTFLRTLTNELCKKRQGESPQFELLAEIDPTELANRESFFLHVLSAIQKKYATNQDGMRIVIEHIEKMAKGLKLLSNTEESYLEDIDANLYVEESFSQCASSTALRENFGKLIEKLYHDYGERTFVVTIDDADMNFSKCKEIIETVRKYMYTPYLVFIFTGDIKLYSLVIRGMQLEHFGELALRYDHANAKQRQNLLNTLQTQYMQKMFPLENRISLPNTRTLLLGSEEHDVTWHEDERHKHSTLEQLIKSSLFSLAGAEDGMKWLTSLCDLPLRSILQLAHSWCRPKHDEQPGQADLRLLTDGLILIYENTLQASGIDVSSIHNGDFLALMQTARTFAAGFNDTDLPGEENYEKQDEIYKITSLYLHSEASAQTRTLSRKLIWQMSLYPFLELPKTISIEKAYGILQPVPPSADTQLHPTFYFPRYSEYAKWGCELTALSACHIHQINDHNSFLFGKGVMYIPDSHVKYYAKLIKKHPFLGILIYLCCCRIGTVGYYLSLYKIMAFIIWCLELEKSESTKKDFCKALSFQLINQYSIQNISPLVDIRNENFDTASDFDFVDFESKSGYKNKLNCFSKHMWEWCHRLNQIPTEPTYVCDYSNTWKEASIELKKRMKYWDFCTRHDKYNAYNFDPFRATHNEYDYAQFFLFFVSTAQFYLINLYPLFPLAIKYEEKTLISYCPLLDTIKKEINRIKM